MSDLQRTFAKSRLGNLPPMLPESFDENEEDETENIIDLPTEHFDDDSSSASSASSTGTIKPTINSNLFARPSGSLSRKSSALAPIPWTSYFERELHITQTTAALKIVHHIYLISPTGPAPLFVTHHGAGSSGLSFASLAAEIRKILPGAGILSLDARGHGLTTVETLSHIPESDGVLDVSLETLSADVVTVLQKTKEEMGWSSMPNLVLIGHSLGGAVMTDVAFSGHLGSDVLGYAVLDMVEKTALDALAAMTGYLSVLPSSFPTLEKAIEWHVRSGKLHNRESARVSVPGILRHEEGGLGRWVWRSDLITTERFWKGWFNGLSEKFLTAKSGKLLVLAGTDRLDKDMMIGQMQGKYALQVFPEAGHFLHEDQPEKTAVVVVDFYKRNDRSALVLPPKVSDMLKSGQKV